jgi:hypothetical protein
MFTEQQIYARARIIAAVNGDDYAALPAEKRIMLQAQAVRQLNAEQEWEHWCKGCGRTFGSERALRSHQTARGQAVACLGKWTR